MHAGHVPLCDFWSHHGPCWTSFSKTHCPWSGELVVIPHQPGQTIPTVSAQFLIYTLPGSCLGHTGKEPHRAKSQVMSTFLGHSIA